MKIPSKITKRQFTALNKKNTTMLSEAISGAEADYKATANNLALNKTCIEGLDEKLTDGGHKDTTRYWMVELNACFRLFVTNRNRIYKAYQKGLK